MVSALDALLVINKLNAQSTISTSGLVANGLVGGGTASASSGSLAPLAVDAALASAAGDSGGSQAATSVPAD